MKPSIRFATSTNNMTSRSVLTARLDRLERAVERIPGYLWFVLALVLLLVKSGLYFGHNFPAAALSDGSKRPDGWSILLDPSLAAAVALRITTRPLYEVFALALSIAVLALIAYLVYRAVPGIDGRLVFLVIAVGPIGALLFRHFGRYDTYLVLGAAIVALAYRSRWWVIGSGAVIMAVGNAGQALATSIALAALTMVPDFRAWRKSAAIALSVSLVWFGIATAIADAYSVPSQLDWLPLLAGESVGYFFSTLPLLAYSALGFTWLLVAASLLMIERRWWPWLIISMVVIPMVFMAITVDGTRVGVGVSLLPAFAVLLVVLPRLLAYVRSLGFPGPVTVIAIVAFVMPNPWIGYGELRPAWEWAIHEVHFWWLVFTR